MLLEELSPEQLRHFHDNEIILRGTLRNHIYPAPSGDNTYDELFHSHQDFAEDDE